nr:MAG TPA: hypothetical protein [Caudoviricetes sp.]
MTFQDLYPGQRVRILSWDELNSISQYHFNGLLLPDRSIFNNKMKYLCGVTATVTDHIRSFSTNYCYFNSSSLILDDGVSLSTNRNDGLTWLLSPAMLAPLNESPSAVPPAISFDQLLAGGELPQ